MTLASTLRFLRQLLARRERTDVSRFRPVDRAFVGIVVGVFVLNFGVARAITGRPALPADALVVDELFGGRLTGPIVLPLPPPPKEPATTPRPTGTRTARLVRPGKASPRSGDQLQRELATRGLLGAINGLGSGPTFADQLSAGIDLRSLDDALRGARHTSTGADEPGARRGTDTGTVQAIGALDTGGGERRSERAESLVQRSPSVTFEPEPDDHVPGCDGAAIARQVKRNLTAIQRCYEAEIKRAPGLQGKITVRFTVGASGRVTEVEIDEDTVRSGALARCIEHRFRSWSFGAHDGEECTFSHPFVFAPVL